MSSDVRDARGSSEDGFHEIQLSGKQLVFLFMATTVVSIVIFLCGVLVGRGVRAEASIGAGAPLGAEPMAQATPAEEATPIDEEVVLPEATTVASGELSYHERLNRPDGAAERVPPESGPAAARTAPVEQRPAASPPPPEPPAEAEPAPAPPAARAGRAPVAEGFAVQVTALREKKDAEAIVRRLMSRGYEAYVLDAEPGQAPLYRVRVGSYADRREAERVLRRLEQEEKFKPWITRTR